VIDLPSAMTLDELYALPVVVPLWPEAGRAFGLGRTATYQLAKTGQFPCRILRLGNAWKVPRADLLRALGETDPLHSERADPA
jgi:hypothetical protein